MVGNNIKCNLSADGQGTGGFGLLNANISNANKIGNISNILTLVLRNNNLTEFNPAIMLDVNLTSIELNNNQFSNSGYTATESWANAQPAFTNNCNVFFGNNTDSVANTTLASILANKNCTVNA
jgi:Leucine-rich repeat (LRR) protein